MIAFSNLHILTVKHGEVYVHHFWLLVFLAALVFSFASSNFTAFRDKDSHARPYDHERNGL